MLLVHTGMGGAIMEMRGKPEVDVLLGGLSGLNGQDARLLQWITESRIAAICSDNQAVEAYTTRPPSLPLHLHCVFKLGVPLGEVWWLGDLARKRICFIESLVREHALEVMKNVENLIGRARCVSGRRRALRHSSSRTRRDD
jgi:hypothetical protein